MTAAPLRSAARAHVVTGAVQAATAWARVVGRLLATRGTDFARVVDAATGGTLAEGGPADDVADDVTEWAAADAAADRAAGGGLLGPSPMEDLLLATEDAYHLVRRLPVGERTLLVQLRIDRRRGTPGSARRDLADPALHDELWIALEPGAAPRPVVEPSRPVLARPLAEPRSGSRPVLGPLPARRPSPPVQPAPVPPAPVETPAARGWATDLDTVRRLLTALQRTA